MPELPAGLTYTAAAICANHTILLRSDGSAVKFGGGFWPQGGPGADFPELPAGLQYTAAAMGFSHAVLLRSDGEAVPVGTNYHGETKVAEAPWSVAERAVARRLDNPRATVQYY